MGGLRGVALTASAVAGGVGVVGVAAYLGLVTGAAPLDLRVGRRTRPLGPLSIDIDAPRDVVFAVVAAPYADRMPKAMRQKVRVLERGSDMVLAAHYTPIAGRLRATTVETVRFQRPSRVHFSLVRGPVPYVKETFHLDEHDDQTILSYHGELATDLWAPGRWWGNVVAARWEAVVSSSFDTIKEQAERRGKQRGV